eukprot:CAMPEP_0182442760 /NCGR_PEP_ID=MMETSP1172-20130603/1648_1 /TAXON_ID=708627 /ORGANISM="Timspurckia oligopyrenoides, Strain CCMP3278" /LENGTH=226 /DNA_ID=CAMNT_0024637783 /DNA_START=14 /DNA_END=694 /DNA_ORIENTATION=+
MKVIEEVSRGVGGSGMNEVCVIEVDGNVARRAAAKRKEDSSTVYSSQNRIGRSRVRETSRRRSLSPEPRPIRQVVLDPPYFASSRPGRLRKRSPPELWWKEHQHRSKSPSPEPRRSKAKTVCSAKKAPRHLRLRIDENPVPLQPIPKSCSSASFQASLVSSCGEEVLPKSSSVRSRSLSNSGRQINIDKKWMQFTNQDCCVKSPLDVSSKHRGARSARSAMSPRFI